MDEEEYKLNTVDINELIKMTQRQASQGYWTSTQQDTLDSVQKELNEARREMARIKKTLAESAIRAATEQIELVNQIMEYSNTPELQALLQELTTRLNKLYYDTYIA